MAGKSTKLSRLHLIGVVFVTGVPTVETGSWRCRVLVVKKGGAELPARKKPHAISSLLLLLSLSCPSGKKGGGCLPQNLISYLLVVVVVVLVVVITSMSCPGGKEGRSLPARKKPHVISSLEYALAIMILAACSSGQSHDAIMSGGWLGWVMGATG